MYPNESESPLHGCWELCATEPEVDLGERVQMQFTPQGSLIYGSLDSGSWQIMLLTFQIIGSELITNQPSAPREERTVFCIRQDGLLQLEFAGTQCFFERILDIAFEGQLRNSRN